CKGMLVPEELTRYRWHGDNLGITRPVASIASVGMSRVEEAM
ncbi:hypothetical protein LCGC14_2193560, partial [marine sediment metagenome]